ncbi:MAG: hypothetical protein V1766_02560 [Pseudomonadota bacterium]
MGFSFSGIEKELTSESFGIFYRNLPKECPRLVAYPTAASLIAFFNDTMQGYAEKDEILSFLIAAYRWGGPARSLSGFFIILFRPAIAAIYRLARKRDSRLDEDDFIQEVCAKLLEIIATVALRPSKVAMQIVGPLRNRMRDRMNRKSARDRLETAWPSDREADARTADGKWDPFGAAEDDIPDAEALLAGLVEEGIIRVKDRDLIIETVIRQRPLKDLTADPTEYQRLKKRRQRALTAMREHLRNSSK